jgi:predicted SAM-dependent methyltransferase
MKENTVDVIYHSHVLEHLYKDDGEKFIKDCFRVLKPSGIIRIAVPDLEKICKEYLKNLELAYLSKKPENIKNYYWNILEIFDQFVRTESG